MSEDWFRRKQTRICYAITYFLAVKEVQVRGNIIGHHLPLWRRRFVVNIKCDIGTIYNIINYLTSSEVCYYNGIYYAYSTSDTTKIYSLPLIFIAFLLLHYINEELWHNIRYPSLCIILWIRWTSWNQKKDITWSILCGSIKYVK